MMRKFLLGVLVVILSVVFISSGYLLWYFNRPLPESITIHPLFEGIEYSRDVRREPYPYIIHVAAIDLTNPEIALLVTPQDDLPDFQHRARTVSEFVEDYDLQLAINADFFSPWYANAPWDYYPHSGDGVNTRGLVYSNGERVTEGYAEETAYHSMFVHEGNLVVFEETDTVPLQAVSGNFMLVVNGEITPQPDENLDPYFTTRHPRTAVGLSEDGKTLMFFVIDGRQPNYSQGATIRELAEVTLEFGAYNALNLDGGGSSTMVIADENNISVLNSPIHTRVPGRERPVANHIGVYAPTFP